MNGTGTIATLFVYGTLMPASGHPMAARLKAQSRYLGPGRIAAKLYNLGSYPGAVPSDEARDSVHGDVVKLLRPAATLAWLDEYEGCGAGAPEPHAYQRVIAPVVLSTGESLNAWVYFYKMPVHRARQVPYGRFLGN
jgi:gamma-glutamylcyclotransferase (GGCT)/AIG2-like uncharacterized protein YtfP